MSVEFDPKRAPEWKAQFLAFLDHCYINSKERGGNYCLGSGLYTSQRRFIDFVFDGLAEDIHDFKVLKSRQLGISTIARALGVFWLGIFDGIQGSLVFDTDGHKEEAREEMVEIVRNLPSSVRFPWSPKCKCNRYLMTFENQAKLRFASAGVRNSRSSGTLGRSSGVNLGLNSEICSWENDEGIKSLRATYSKNFPARLYLWESTGRGYNVWHDMWEEAKGDTLNQRTLFVGWWSKDDQIIPRNTARFEKYGLEPPSGEETEKIARVKELYGWTITPEQLAWYREYIDPNKQIEDGDPADAVALQEQPWDEVECWQRTGASFFSPERLKIHSDNAAAIKPASQWKFYPGTDFIACSFETARTYRDVDLKVWEEPVHGAAYVVAADPAFGHDEHNDRSACNVLRCYADGLDQVAEFASASTPTHQFAWLIASLVGWYCMAGVNPVIPIIEINGPGEAVWREYKALNKIVTNGYLRLEAKTRGLQNIFNNVRQYVYARSDGLTGGHNLHFKTSAQLKEAIMERLRDMVHTGDLVLRSTETLREMEAVVRDGSSIRAEGHRHDDRVYTLAMGIRAWEDQLRNTLIAQHRTREADKARTELSPQARYNLFTKHTLDTMFRAKRVARVSAQIQERRASWRFR